MRIYTQAVVGKHNAKQKSIMYCSKINFMHRTTSSNANMYTDKVCCCCCLVEQGFCCFRYTVHLMEVKTTRFSFKELMFSNNSYKHTNIESRVPLSGY